MTLLLRNMTVYTRFNRFQHCAINKDEDINRCREQVEKIKRNITQKTDAFFIRKIAK